MSNVVEFPNPARTVEQVLDNAKSFTMTHIVVVGFNEKTGEPFCDASVTELSKVILMLERAKFQLLAQDYASIDDDNASPGLTS